jgi:electron transport complex protein RnfD
MKAKAFSESSAELLRSGSAGTISRGTRPFLKASVSVAGLHWPVAAVLAILMVCAAFPSGWNVFRAVFLSVFAAIAADALNPWASAAGGRFASALRLRDGSLVLLGMLTAFLLPARSPWWMFFAGSFFAVWVGRGIFGGLGSYVFHPALLAKAFLLYFFPARAAGSLVPGGTGIWAVAFALLTIAGGLVLIDRQALPWRVPFYFLAAQLIASVLAGRDALSEILAANSVWIAFFYLADFGTAPLTPPGRILYAVGGGLAVSLFCRGGLSAPAVYAALFLNAFAPLIDRYVRPRILGEPRRAFGGNIS